MNAKLDKGKKISILKLRWFDDDQTDIETLGTKRSIHEDQHGDKNGRESQGRLRSEPKDRNVNDEGYFYNSVFKSGENLKR